MTEYLITIYGIVSVVEFSFELDCNMEIIDSSWMHCRTRVQFCRNHFDELFQILRLRLLFCPKKNVVDFIGELVPLLARVDAEEFSQKMNHGTGLQLLC